MEEMEVGLEGFDFKRHAIDEVISFWLEHSIDEEFGGFWTHLERDGKRYGKGDKFLVMQSRMVYSFTTAYRLTGDDEYLDIARRGASFIMDHMWDSKHGGWFWAVRRSGRYWKEMGSKRAYGHAFVMYALAEFARTADDSRAREMALETYELTFQKMWDKERGGLYQVMDEDWYLRDETKRLDTHLHTLEALSALAALTDDSWFRDEMIRICDLICDRMFNEKANCMREWFLPNWEENLEETKGWTDYGHDLEAAWFLWVIGSSLDIDRYVSIAKKLLDFVMERGWDERHGGVYSKGEPLGEPRVREKVWWVQCEGIGALSFAYRMEGEEVYRDRLDGLVSFCYRRFFDDKYGEWFHLLSEEGEVRDERKGGEWKAAYHVMQACYHAHRNLQSLGEPVGKYSSGLL